MQRSPARPARRAGERCGPGPLRSGGAAPAGTWRTLHTRLAARTSAPPACFRHRSVSADVTVRLVRTHPLCGRGLRVQIGPLALGAPAAPYLFGGVSRVPIVLVRDRCDRLRICQPPFPGLRPAREPTARSFTSIVLGRPRLSTPRRAPVWWPPGVPLCRPRRLEFAAARGGSPGSPGGLRVPGRHVVSPVTSPGAGKTALLEETLRRVWRCHRTDAACRCAKYHRHGVLPRRGDDRVGPRDLRSRVTRRAAHRERRRLGVSGELRSRRGSPRRAHLRDRQRRHAAQVPDDLRVRGRRCDAQTGSRGCDRVGPRRRARGRGARPAGAARP